LQYCCKKISDNDKQNDYKPSRQAQHRSVYDCKYSDTLSQTFAISVSEFELFVKQVGQNIHQSRGMMEGVKSVPTINKDNTL